MRGGFVVILVAEYFVTGNFLCDVHSGELPGATLLCQGEAVKGQLRLWMVQIDTKCTPYEHPSIACCGLFGAGGTTESG